MNAWGEPEGQEILDELMKEVPIVSSASEQPQVSNQTPTVNLQIPPTNDPILSSPASGSTPVRSDPELEDMQKRMAALKTGSPANFVSQSGAQGKVQMSSVERFSSPASMTLPYPGLDGHPRQITPIPISIPEPPSKSGWFWSALSNRWLKTPELIEKEKLAELQAATEDEAESSIKKGSQTSGSNRATIGETTISTSEAAMIRKEVQSAIRQAFPGINFSTGQTQAEVIDLAGSTALSAPLAIAGSEVSIASTQPNNGTEESKTSFSQMMSGRGTVTSAQTFATA